MSKAHNHTPMQIREMDGNFVETPHTCDDPACPGNINRQKLEMFDEMFELLIQIDLWGMCPRKKIASINLIGRAKKIQEADNG